MDDESFSIGMMFWCDSWSGLRKSDSGADLSPPLSGPGFLQLRSQSLEAIDLKGPFCGMDKKWFQRLQIWTVEQTRKLTGSRVVGQFN